MKMSTRKVGKFDKNNRKSKKKYIKKRRKYTQKGRGLVGDRAKKLLDSVAAKAVKFTRGPVNRESMRELQEEMKKRQEERNKELNKIDKFSCMVSGDCPLCISKLQDEAGEALKVDTTYTLEELEDVKNKSGICQPCNQCNHPFHIGCVKYMYDKNSNKSSKCPLCRDESFREFQNINYVTQKLQENKDKLKTLQSELRELLKELEGKKGPPPRRYNEIQSIIKELELDIKCYQDWLDPNISQDEYIKLWPR